MFVLHWGEEEQGIAVDARGLPLFLQECTHARKVSLRKDQELELLIVRDVVGMFRPEVHLESLAPYSALEPFPFQVADLLFSNVFLSREKDAVQVGQVGKIDPAV